MKEFGDLFLSLDSFKYVLKEGNQAFIEFNLILNFDASETIFSKEEKIRKVLADSKVKSSNLKLAEGVNLIGFDLTTEVISKYQVFFTNSIEMHF